MAIQFDLPKAEDSIIKVIGVGGGGSNAVNHMYNQGIIGVNFVVGNTDEQALTKSPVPTKVQLGPGLTQGRGAGSKPEVGKNATLESMDDIKQALGSSTKMVFITAGMGGGTGTGGAPVVAKAARELGILTVGIVTMPFAFEGRKRTQQAFAGIEEMKECVDTLVVISNDKVRELHGNLSLREAFAEADNVLATAAKGIAEIITVPGYVNVDFEDVSTVMRNSGVAIMGTGVADGEDRATKAVKMAMESPLLNDNDIRGAKYILLNVTSGTREVLMDEVGEITNYIQDAAGYTSEIIWGNCTDEALEEKISVTVIATGFETNQERKAIAQKPERIVLSLDDDKRDKGRTRGKSGLNLNIKDSSGSGSRYRAESSFGQPQKPAQDNTTTHFKASANYKDKAQEERRRLFLERKNRLRGLSMKLKSPSQLNSIENEPAYKRRNIQLEDVPHSSESNISKYSLLEDEYNNTELKKRNPFLHDNVD